MPTLMPSLHFLKGFGVCARAVIETAAVLGMDKSHEIAKMRLVIIVIRHIIQFT